MSSFKSSIQWGVKWIAESIQLFRMSPKRAMLLALAYVILFIMLPSIPNFEWFSIITVLIWPSFMAAAIAVYRQIDQKQILTFLTILKSIQPKIPLLLRLGALSFLYIAMMGWVLSGDFQNLALLHKSETPMTESQMQAMLEVLAPLLIQSIFLLIPLMMATWFSPMLIAFEEYALGEAIKSSLITSLQYMISLGVAWFLLSAGIAFLMLVIGVVIGFVTSAAPQIAELLMLLMIFACLLLATALMIAFQYVSYRDIFTRSKHSI